MLRKHIPLHRVLIALSVLVGVLLFGGNVVEAQWGGWYGGERSNSLREKIENLGEERVEGLSIPVLLAVGTSDLTRNFGDARGGGTRTHEGLDMMAPAGTPVVSPTEAVVVRVGSGSGSGIFVSTANPGGETFVYMHLDDTADIDEGDELEAGDLIGFVGNTGNASGGPAHLHFEIREDRVPLDPYIRLTKEFSAEDTAESLKKILREVEEGGEYAEFLKLEFGDELLDLETAGAELPDLLQSGLSSGKGKVLISRDLSVGDSGEDVRALQRFLEGLDYLTLDSVTGYFGPLTLEAVKEYQSDEDISPVSGYVGPLTRASMGLQAGDALEEDEEETIEELRAQIAELLKVVEELTALLAARRGH